ncbi:MAG: hypothetical protein AAFU38_17760, partial [Bacteroidota bacterium]
MTNTKGTVPGIDVGPAICYSGYRAGQSPVTEDYPTYEQVCEDLRLLAPTWRYLRLYVPRRHAVLVLVAFRAEGFPFQVLL